MASGSIHVKVSGILQDHVQRQVGEGRLYEDAEEYVRALIRQDMLNRDDAWNWLKAELEPGLRAADSEFITVKADDVIARNRRS